MVSTRITLPLSRILVERVSDAAKLGGLARDEYIRRAIVAAVERTDALAVRRARQAKQGERCR